MITQVRPSYEWTWWNVQSYEPGLTQLLPHDATSVLTLPSDTVKKSQSHTTAEVGSDPGKTSAQAGHLELAARVIFMPLSSSRWVKIKCQSTTCPYSSPSTFTSRHLTRNATPIFSKACFKANYLHSWETKQLITPSSPFPQKLHFQGLPACTILPRTHRTQKHLACHRGTPPEPRGKQWPQSHTWLPLASRGPPSSPGIDCGSAQGSSLSQTLWGNRWRECSLTQGHDQAQFLEKNQYRWELTSFVWEKSIVKPILCFNGRNIHCSVYFVTIHLLY